MKRWTALVALALALVAACAKHQPEWPVVARVGSEEADTLAARGSYSEGAELLERLAQSLVPARIEGPVELALAQDSWAHAAQLRLSARQPAAAENAADAGLALGETSDVYEATLHILRGRARELVGNSGGAALDYDRAAQIDEKLLEATAHGDPR
jgi:hypothetical protein